MEDHTSISSNLSHIVASITSLTIEVNQRIQALKSIIKNIRLISQRKV